MFILFDQDNVVSDFDGHLGQLLAEKHPEIQQMPLDTRTTFYYEDDYPEHRGKISRVYLERGFFLDLPLIHGAKEGLLRLLELGHDVRICTSPVTKNDYCLYEKYHWIKQNLPEFTKRLIVTKDKTLIRGDVLVDDKPKITGVMSPRWKHILFDQPYNRRVSGPRMSWDKFEEFLALLERLQAPAD